MSVFGVSSNIGACSSHIYRNPVTIAALRRQQEKALERTAEYQAMMEAKAEKEREADCKRKLIMDAYRVVDCGNYGKQRLAMHHIKQIAEARGYTVKVITGISRNKSVVRVRDECIAAVYLAFPRKSLPELGRIFNRDHTSILASLRRSGTYVSPAIRAKMDDNASKT